MLPYVPWMPAIKQYYYHMYYNYFIIKIYHGSASWKILDLNKCKLDEKNNMQLFTLHWFQYKVLFPCFTYGALNSKSAYMVVIIIMHLFLNHAMVLPCKVFSSCDYDSLDISAIHDDVIKWEHFPLTGPLCGEFTSHGWIPHTKASYTELWYFLWSAPEKMAE